jgi:hypothetical protein
MKFQRIGGLQLTKQNGYDPSLPGFHSPPKAKGVYAFPWPYFEWFLLGSKTYSGAKTKHAKFEYVRDDDGNKIHWKEWQKILDEKKSKNLVSEKEYESLLYKWSDDDGFIVKPKRIRIFNYTGEIWHHLGNHAKPGQIYETKGSWYLSSIEDYLVMLNKEKHAMIKQTAQWLGPYERKAGNKLQFPIKPNIALDHMEVFISNKI